MAVEDEDEEEEEEETVGVVDDGLERGHVCV